MEINANYKSVLSVESQMPKHFADLGHFLLMKELLKKIFCTCFRWTNATEQNAKTQTERRLSDSHGEPPSQGRFAASYSEGGVFFESHQ